MRLKDTLERFSEVVPRNEVDWYGSVLLWSTRLRQLFSISFGSGDNLDSEDRKEGFDDYLVIDRTALDGTRCLEDILEEVRSEGTADESTEGLMPVDGGMLLIRRSEWKDGDIRRFIGEALEFVGYELGDFNRNYSDIIYIGGHPY